MKRIALALLVVLAGCTSSGSGGGAPEPTGVFTADEVPAGPAVFVRGRAEGTTLQVDVVARGAPDLHGAALRLAFDPDALAFTSAEASSAWSRKSMAVAKEGTPGQLAIAWFEKGARGIKADAETVLGTLTFDVKTKSPSAITFRTERSSIVDHDGKRIDTTFRGGRVR